MDLSSADINCTNVMAHTVLVKLALWAGCQQVKSLISLWEWLAHIKLLNLNT